MSDPGTALMVMGSLAGGVAANNAAKTQAAALERQAKMEQMQAEEDARRARAEGEKLKGKQMASFMKGGVTIEGTPEEVLTETAEDIELDALSIIHGGQSRAESHRFSAASKRAEGKSALISSSLTAGGMGLKKD